jgi:hypothetical protein
VEPNPDGMLTPGIYCTIELHIPRKTASLLVPADAIIFNSDGLQVAVVEDGLAHIRKIGGAIWGQRLRCATVSNRATK